MDLFFALMGYPFWLALDIIVSDKDFPEPFVGWGKRAWQFLADCYRHTVEKKPRRKRPPLLR